MRNGNGLQTVQGIGQGAANMRSSSGANRYNKVNCMGYFGPFLLDVSRRECAFACRIRDWGPLKASMLYLLLCMMAILD